MSTPDTPMIWEGDHARPMTDAEVAQLQADRAAWKVAADAAAAANANAAQMSTSLRAHLQDALTIADALAANTATPAQQRAGLELCLRGTVRLSRLVLDLYDQAP